MNNTTITTKQAGKIIAQNKELLRYYKLMRDFIFIGTIINMILVFIGITH